MLLLEMVAIVAAVVGTALLTLFGVCLGRAPLERLRTEPRRFGLRLRESAPYALGLGVVLALNKGLQGYIAAFNTAVAYRATETIYSIEGEFVAAVQHTIPAEATIYFSVMYVFGYVTIAVFPVIAYFFADSLHALKLTLTAYGLNYAGGIVCYTFVLAYGPRQHLAGVDHLLVDLYPQVTTLTSQVNRAHNVFPSLHTSLSVTVVLLAFLTRDEFPRWFAIASAIGSSIVVSTMYLGIHWALDVLAGILLAVGSVYGAIRVVDVLDSPTSRPGRSTASRASDSD
jgi:membrane-associated phospholipid phosphatase